MICSKCKAAKDAGARLPKGWKRSGESIYCSTCWRGRMILRAVATPVVEIIDGTWDNFRGAIHEQWAAVTAATNWMMTELYARDVRRNGEAKMPPMARVYLYPETRAQFPSLPSQTCAALEQAVQAKYRAKRYEVVWTCAASLPTARYPQPFPVPNQGWSVAMEQDRPVVSVRLGDRRWSLRLKAGPRYQRQIAAVRQLVAGEAEQGQLDLYEQRIDGKKAVMCKMVAWLPRGEAKNLDGTLMVRSAPDSLLIAVNAKDERIWTYHADHIRRWSAEHREQLQRWADDSKFEQRPIPSFTERRESAARKYRHRMNSAVREIAAQLAGYAARRKFAELQYDDGDTSYCPGFPWAELRARIAVDCDERGVKVERASTEEPQKIVAALAE